MNVQASGRINVKNCSSAIYLQDINADGIFEHLEQGTNLQIDRNNDGKIWGKEEWLYSKEIIDFCGQNFLISSIAPDGSFLVIEPTNLQIAKVGMKTPPFELLLLNGKKISSGKLTGKPILLDFWASWCAPCVEKLPEAKSLEKEISVFYINTDKKSRVRFADEIITSGQADLVFIGRELLREPDWAIKAQHAMEAEPAWPIQYGYAVKRRAK